MDPYTARLALKTHLGVSALFGILFVGTAVQDILSVGTYYIWPICLCCPAIIMVSLVTSSVWFLRPQSDGKPNYAPLAINACVTGIGIVLAILAQVRDWAFQVHYPEYVQVVQAIQQNEFQRFGRIVVLPRQYRHLAIKGQVYVEDADGLSVFFKEGDDDLDGLAWGYIYYSDNTLSSVVNNKCGDKREVRPPVRNWYYCQSHALFKELSPDLYVPDHE